MLTRKKPSPDYISQNQGAAVCAQLGEVGRAVVRATLQKKNVFFKIFSTFAKKFQEIMYPRGQIEYVSFDNTPVI